MDRRLREAVIETIRASRSRKIETIVLLDAVRRQATGLADFELEQRLRTILEGLQHENLLRLPKNKVCGRTGLPAHVTALRPEEDAAREANRVAIARLRNETAWEPTRMAAFAHNLKHKKELEAARAVNRYLLHRKAGTPRIPHRERALMIFGQEKALDRYVRHGLFGGRITLADLDCFYCPEPLPFRALAMDICATAGKPLLVVENANTYWSCCQANNRLQRYAAIVYGQGFKVTANAAERANDGLEEIVSQLGATGIFYFGDLDPTGIAIPVYINRSRADGDLAPLFAEPSLYRALLEKGVRVPPEKSDKQVHDPALAKLFLGNTLADIYLDGAPVVRWPQEGLTAADIEAALTGTGGNKDQALNT